MHLQLSDSQHRFSGYHKPGGTAIGVTGKWARLVIDGGDDCEIGVILKAMHEMCRLEVAPTRRSHSRGHSRGRHHHDGDDDEWKDASEERYGWIPSKALEALFGGPAPRSEIETSALDRAGPAAPGIRSQVGDPGTNTVAKGQITRDIIAAPEGDGQSAQTVIPS